MIQHIPFLSLYLADHGWLKSRFHFSFAEYFNKDNMHFGVLRVMNDDLIAPHSGFGEHPHSDMEIVSYVLRGELTHQDSMGNKESLGRGAIQYMSAGTGVTHSELNEGDDEAHLIQTWILPRAKNLAPHYGSMTFDPEQRHNTWLHLIGPEGTGAAIHLSQDANLFVGEIDAGNSLTFTVESGRQLFVKVMEGEGKINGISFMPGDAAEVEGEPIIVEAGSRAHLLLVEMAQG